MKVLLINSVCGYGSTGKIVVELHNKLTENGHECCVAYGRGAAPKGVNTIKFGNKFDFYRHILMTRFFDAHGFGSKRTTRKLIDQITRYNPDVIHLHNIHGYFLNVELLFVYIKQKNIPVIWTLHDCWALTGHCSHFDSIGCSKWKDQCEKCELKKEYPTSWVLDCSARNHKRKKKAFLGVENLIFVTPSKWLANILKQSYLKEYKVVVIPNGIDTNIFRPLKEDEKLEKKKELAEKYNIDFSKKIFIGVASVWTKEKGFDDFIKIANKNLKDVQIVLIGVNKKQKGMLPEGMIGVERTENQQELVAFYACADAFLNLTYADTFPTVNMEAICNGTPVITYDTCGSPENVPEGCGIVVTKGDYEKAVCAAMEIKKDTSLYEAYKQFDKSVFLTKYYELITKR